MTRARRRGKGELLPRIVERPEARFASRKEIREVIDEFILRNVVDGARPSIAGLATALEMTTAQLLEAAKTGKYRNDIRAGIQVIAEAVEVALLRGEKAPHGQLAWLRHYMDWDADETAAPETDRRPVTIEVRLVQQKQADGDG